MVAFDRFSKITASPTSLNLKAERERGVSLAMTHQKKAILEKFSRNPIPSLFMKKS